LSTYYPTLGLLTLARTWTTVTTGDFFPKDKAAEWAAKRLPAAHADLLETAAKAYRGETDDDWQTNRELTTALAERLRKEIEARL
jgi:streptomycin 3"-adenylyltransferase